MPNPFLPLASPLLTLLPIPSPRPKDPSSHLSSHPDPAPAHSHMPWTKAIAGGKHTVPNVWHCPGLNQPSPRPLAVTKSFDSLTSRSAKRPGSASWTRKQRRSPPLPAVLVQWFPMLEGLLGGLGVWARLDLVTSTGAETPFPFQGISPVSMHCVYCDCCALTTLIGDAHANGGVHDGRGISGATHSRFSGRFSDVHVHVHASSATPTLPSRDAWSLWLGPP
ncbi:hypothetical protein B0J13DRAFT_523721 [Dactylonectria estremocensis]|uniref:Uncharacterized protein n=1 Tax=Dactylonectria estremocensis TaxID=1079267 RepID=A0A9P9EWC7_9HYPO|nr:hypothetical protein B0J13DRAFT_523721 [Dactylonectria estremocensis]